MREDIWTVIKYKPKAGCEDEFEQALKRLGDMMIENKPYQFLNDFGPQDNPKINDPIKDLIIKFLESEYLIEDL